MFFDLCRFFAACDGEALRSCLGLELAFDFTVSFWDDRCGLSVGSIGFGNEA